ncbi:MAG TPA: dephospho-CoA kinase [Polyangia bacterium]|nr:dephospho-CoA kinase [Polyangia bacterium]
MARAFRVVGLTGGIGTGKSTVARMFAARGVPVVDADGLAREVVAPGTVGNAEVAAAWPRAIGPDGAIDRKRLAAIVFADPAARTRLEAITHPLIQQASAARLTDLAGAGHALAIYEAALLVESGRWRDFDGLIVVTASPETQIARALARGGMTLEEAEARVRAQLPTEQKVNVATWVIDNDGTLAETERQVERVLGELRRGV